VVDDISQMPAEAGEALRTHAWELAAATVDDALRSGEVSSLARLGRPAQLGELPTFVTELGREIGQPAPDRMRLGSALAAVARDHGRTREALGFAPRELLTEFLLLRRVLWRFVAEQTHQLAPERVLELQRDLHELLDRVFAECLVAYVERVTAVLTEHAQEDPVTGLLNEGAFAERLEREIARAARYDRGVVLVIVGVGGITDVSQERGHVETDRVLNRLGRAAADMLRTSDAAGRLRVDEFALLLVEADRHAGGRFLHRFREALQQLRTTDDVPQTLVVTAGSAHFPTDGVGADDLLRVADLRRHESMRAALRR
jgi:diguanylate cyclase (GGDEF)-like protein